MTNSDEVVAPIAPQASHRRSWKATTLRLVRIIGILIFSAAQPANGQGKTRPTALTHVSVIDTADGSTQRDVTVLIKGNRVAEIGADVTIPTDALILDERGNYLIPGLWDMHVHTAFGGWFPAAKQIMFPLFIANGVTGVRDMGSVLPRIRSWRNEIRSGTLLGPRIVMAGPMLDGPRPSYPASIAIHDPSEARNSVRRLKQQGVDFIKVQSGIPRDAYFAVADEAKKEGLTFVGHVPDAVRATEGSDAGQKSIEHFTGIFEGCSEREDQLLIGPKGPHIFVQTYSAQRAEALIRELAKNQTWQVPTLVTERVQWLIEDIASGAHPLAKYAPAFWKDQTWKIVTELIRRQLANEPISDRRRFVQLELETTRLMHAAGIPFMAGTDTAPGPYVMPGFSIHDELELFVAAGFTPLEALQTATLNPAKFLGMTKDLGTVTTGKIADLVLLTADPLQDISNTRRIATVIVNGRLLSRDKLDQMLNRVRELSSRPKSSQERIVGRSK